MSDAERPAADGGEWRPAAESGHYRSTEVLETDQVRYWAAIAVTAAIASLAGIIVHRLAADVFDTTLVISDRGTGELVLLSDSTIIWTCVLVTVAAAGVMQLLLHLVPHPQTFFGLLATLVLLASLLLPFNIAIEDAQRVWLIGLHLVVGVIISTLVANVAAMTTRVRPVAD